MLTGLIPIDQGSAIIEGHNLKTEMDMVRQNLGVCPQHDILYNEMTVEEHSTLFASFKGVPSADIKNAVNETILIVGLTEKRKAFSKNLSGGQKRKLSVGIAFIGGSRVVLLDEPTSGMDPYSRRFTWNLIRQQKKGRIIVLTTHFMVFLNI
jgi:ABC-type multidrug transport system ATPase subunit